MERGWGPSNSHSFKVGDGYLFLHCTYIMTVDFNLKIQYTLLCFILYDDMKVKGYMAIKFSGLQSNKWISF